MQIKPDPFCAEHINHAEIRNANQMLRAVTKQTMHQIATYKLPYQRVRQIRERLTNPATRDQVHPFDRRVLQTGNYRSPLLKNLLRISQSLEETGEAIADLSSTTERLTRHLISSGEKNDMGRLIASACGRSFAGLITSHGLAFHKITGCALMSLSTMLALTGVGLSYTSLGTLVSETYFDDLAAGKHVDTQHQIYPTSAKILLSIKTYTLKWVRNKSRNTPLEKPFKILKRRLLKNKPHHFKPTQRRSASTGYMWNNLHQYSRGTRVLMGTAGHLFTIVNKGMVSYDKHLGSLLGKKVFARALGKLIGVRLGLVLSTAIAAAVSLATAPLQISLSTLGILTCATALVLVLASKANVRFNGGWRGDFSRPYLANSPFRPVAA